MEVKRKQKSLLKGEKMKKVHNLVQKFQQRNQMEDSQLHWVLEQIEKYLCKIEEKDLQTLALQLDGFLKHTKRGIKKKMDSKFVLYHKSKQLRNKLCFYLKNVYDNNGKGERILEKKQYIFIPFQIQSEKSIVCSSIRRLYLSLLFMVESKYQQNEERILQFLKHVMDQIALCCSIKLEEVESGSASQGKVVKIRKEVGILQNKLEEKESIGGKRLMIEGMKSPISVVHLVRASFLDDEGMKEWWESQNVALAQVCFFTALGDQFRVKPIINDKQPCLYCKKNAACETNKIPNFLKKPKNRMMECLTCGQHFRVYYE